jgi:hypothetical protein
MGGKKNPLICLYAQIIKHYAMKAGVWGDV